MNVRDVEARVEHIQAISGDDEQAHSKEDDLRQQVLEAIATGAENPAELAAAALRTSEIDFARWCA